ncbi:MAG: hypothetical protein Q9174_001507 [Haloplaca sp. 1 TL-2023]
MNHRDRARANMSTTDIHDGQPMPPSTSRPHSRHQATTPTYPDTRRFPVVESLGVYHASKARSASSMTNTPSAEADTKPKATSRNRYAETRSTRPPDGTSRRPLCTDDSAFLQSMNHSPAQKPDAGIRPTSRPNALVKASEIAERDRSKARCVKESRSRGSSSSPCIQGASKSPLPSRDAPPPIPDSHSCNPRVLLISTDLRPRITLHPPSPDPDPRYIMPSTVWKQPRGLDVLWPRDESKRTSNRMQRREKEKKTWTARLPKAGKKLRKEKKEDGKEEVCFVHQYEKVAET